MDPNATLKELRSLTAVLHDLEEEYQERQDEAEDDWLDEQLALLGLIRDVAARMGELVEALDGWISKGGFLPAAWVR